jgi:hypothetical protein
MAKLLQKVSEPLRDAPDIFFRRATTRAQPARHAVVHAAMLLPVHAQARLSRMHTTPHQAQYRLRMPQQQLC